MDEMRHADVAPGPHDRSQLSSGQWRQPADVGSVGVERGPGFSTASREEVFSANAQARPKPNILSNNLHNGSVPRGSALKQR